MRTLNKDDDAYMSLGQLALSLTKDDILRMSQKAFRCVLRSEISLNSILMVPAMLVFEERGNRSTRRKPLGAE